MNKYGFDTSKVSEEEIILGAIESDVPVFLHGKSGDGKSARIKALDPNAIVLYMRNITPESLNGKSIYNEKDGEMKDVPPTWYIKLVDICQKESDKLHIVFFDELTNALPAIQGMAFNIILDKEINGKWKLPSNARIVAAGNELEDSLAANEMAEPLFGRFLHVYIKTDIKDWLKWAFRSNIHPAIYAFMRLTQGETLRSKYNGKTPNADPRKWEMASKLLYATNKPEMLRSCVGEEITKKFINFCNVKTISLDDILNDRVTKADLEMDIAAKYMTASYLSQEVTESDFEKVDEFVNLLGSEPASLFESYWMRGSVDRMQIVKDVRGKRNLGR